MRHDADGVLQENTKDIKIFMVEWITDPLSVEMIKDRGNKTR